jgi:hypothetical protein
MFTRFIRPALEKPARGLLLMLGWARGPTTDGQAAELACAPRPLGPNLT